MQHVLTDRHNRNALPITSALLDNRYETTEEYHKSCWFMLSHELLLSIREMIRDLELYAIADLCCGTGWASYWLSKYDMPVSASIDNKKGSEKQYLNMVQNEDAADYVKRTPEMQLYFLSWPRDEDPVTKQICGNMREGQYLLYIGESSCCGVPQFGDDNSLQKDRWNMSNSFLTFDGYYDEIRLHRKQK